MMRTATITATRIALLLIFIQAGIGFTNGLGLFHHDFIATPSDQYTKYKVEDISDYKAEMGEGGMIATLVQISQAFLDGLPMAGKILFSVVAIFPTLAGSHGFGLDPLLSAFIQLGIWAIYTLAIAEILTGREFLW